MVILDLEDGCAASARPIARDVLSQTWKWLADSIGSVVVRINGAGTPDHEADIAALAALPPEAAVLLPKPVSQAALARLAHGDRELWCMAEEMALRDRFGSIAEAVPGLSTVVIGIKDLADDLQIPLNPDAALLRAGANALRTAAQAAGLQAIDGMAFGDEQALARRCERAIAEGFDGITFGRLRDCAAASALSGQAPSLHSTPAQEQEDGEYRLN